MCWRWSNSLTLTSMVNLAFIWDCQGQHVDALGPMKACAQAQQRVLGPEHPHALSSLATASKWSRQMDLGV